MILSFLIIVSHITASNAWIHDVDSLHINGSKQEIRLAGIDGVELSQTCKGANGNDYACGVEARQHLADIIGTGTVICQGDKLERYGRLLATCFVNGININRQLVLDGYAVHYMSTDYIVEENDAKANHRGLWAGSFQLPSEFRYKK